MEIKVNIACAFIHQTRIEMVLITSKRPCRGMEIPYHFKCTLLSHSTTVEDRCIGNNVTTSLSLYYDIKTRTFTSGGSRDKTSLDDGFRIRVRLLTIHGCLFRRVLDVYIHEVLLCSTTRALLF